MYGIRILCTLLLCLLFISSAHAEISSLSVIRGKDRFSIPAFVHDRVLYASLTEFSRRLTLPSYESSEVRKFEFRVGETRLKLSADNPFVVVVSHRDNVVLEVYQMPNSVIKTDVAYYAPMASLLPLLSRVWRTSLHLNHESSELRISASSPPTAVVSGAPPASTGKPASIPSTPSATQSSSTEASSASPALAPRAITAEPASRFDITHLSVDSRKNGVLIRVHTRNRPRQFDSELRDDGTLVVTVNGASVDVNEIRQTPTDGASITSVTAEQLGANTRLTFSLNDKFESCKISRDVRNTDLLVSLFKNVDVGQVTREQQSAGGDRSKWKLDCIVIDPGHGGRDPGAIGVSGIKEKNVALGLALKLGKLIEQRMPGVKVVYTRKTDVFVPLDKRGQIANAAGGKLFISLHCNATERKPSNAQGFEVYILRPGRTEEAMRIAEFENSVIKLEKDYEKRYEKLTAENIILLNMAQSAYVKFSERFAELLDREVRKSTQITSKGVKQAGFYVLVGASMPGVLIEAGFISNATEEKFLVSQAGQQHLAERFYEAIAAYAKEYEQSLKE